MAEFPAFPFYCGDYLGDTMHLSLEEHGAYCKLLFIAWQSSECAIPADDVRLARMLGVTATRFRNKIWPGIESFWTKKGDFFYQKKQIKVREKVSRQVKTSRENGKQGGRPKSLKNNDSENPPGLLQDTQEEPDGNLEPNLNESIPKPKLIKKENKQKKESSATAAADASDYAFDGRVIRLNQRDFDRWQSSYPDLALKAELQSLDDWISTEPKSAQAKWFHRVSGALKNRQTAIEREKTQRAKADEIPGAWA